MCLKQVSDCIFRVTVFFFGGQPDWWLHKSSGVQVIGTISAPNLPLPLRVTTGAVSQSIGWSTPVYPTVPSQKPERGDGPYHPEYYTRTPPSRKLSERPDY